MSHVVAVELVVNDLDALEKACNKIGCELIRDHHTYKWWGHWVGDYPLPEGFTTEELGKCNHMIKVKGNNDAFQIGVVKNKNKEGYSLLYDFYGSRGKMIEQKVGTRCGILKQEYTVQALLNKVKTKHNVKRFEEKQEGLKRKIVITLK